MLFEINLSAEFTKTAPIIVISSSLSSSNQTLKKGFNKLFLNFDFDKNDILSVHFLNKDDKDDNIVEIKNIIIDSIDLRHYIFEGEFTPIYNKLWYDSLSVKPPKSYKPGTIMRHSGIWTIPIHTPIWQMVMLFMFPIK
jgi:hypothetical protein